MVETQPVRADPAHTQQRGHAQPNTAQQRPPAAGSHQRAGQERKASRVSQSDPRVSESDTRGESMLLVVLSKL